MEDISLPSGYCARNLLYDRVLVNTQHPDKKVHHQKMIVLGLVAIGKKYGFEIEAFIAETEMTRWAEIGNSTIYKTLKDLEKDAALCGKKVTGDKGPARTEYSLTASGRRQLTNYILNSLKSDKTARLDRISGLFFAPLLKGSVGAPALKQSIAQLNKACETLRAQLPLRKGDVIAEAIIEFYIDMFEAEQRAFVKVSKVFE